MQFCAVINYSGHNSMLKIKSKSLKVYPVITKRGIKIELKSLIAQIYQPLIKLWMNETYQAEISIEFFYASSSFLNIGSRKKAFYSGIKYPFYIEDFIQNGNWETFSNTGFPKIIRLLLGLFNNWIGYTAISKIESALPVETYVKDRRTVLNTNSYVLRNYDEIRERIVKMPSAIVYNNNGRR